MIKKCLFPVAGYGTRFLPVTKTIPKEMLPILAKPLIQYAVEEAMLSGINSMEMVVSTHKKAIENYFKPNIEIENNIKNTSKETLLDGLNYIIDNCRFSFVKQQQMSGLGGAIYSGKSLIDNAAFAVILPDDLCVYSGDLVLEQMVKIHQKYPDYCIVAIEEVPINAVDKYGVIEGYLLEDRVYQVQQMVEKPTPEQAPSNLAIIGRYILTSAIFGILENTPADKNGEVQITDALMSLAKQGKVIAYQFQGKRFDCGSVEGFIEANNHFAQKM